jgi:mannose-1-phosphate guanylyltransferase
MLPKPMLPVGEKPILQHIIEWVKGAGIEDVVVSTGYLGRMIEEYFHDGSDQGVNITYARSPNPLGTAGQLKAAESKIRGRFLCLYGDALLSFDLKSLLAFHGSHKATATIALMKYSTVLRYGFLETDEKGRLTEWREKPTVTGYINVGCYVMEKRFLSYMPPKTMFGMDKAFELAMKARDVVCGAKVEGEFLDIGDRQSYREANDLYVKRLGKVL